MEGNENSWRFLNFPSWYIFLERRRENSGKKSKTCNKQKALKKILARKILHVNCCWFTESFYSLSQFPFSGWLVLVLEFPRFDGKSTNTTTHQRKEKHFYFQQFSRREGFNRAGRTFLASAIATILYAHKIFRSDYISTTLAGAKNISNISSNSVESILMW